MGQFPKRLRRFVWFPILLVLAGAGFLLNVSIAGIRVEWCLPTCARSEPVTDGPIDLLSLNMFHGYPGFENPPRRLRLIEQEIRRLEPDVVLSQQAPSKPETGNVAWDFQAQNDSPAIQQLGEAWREPALPPDGNTPPNCCIDD